MISPARLPLSQAAEWVRSSRAARGTGLPCRHVRCVGGEYDSRCRSLPGRSTRRPPAAAPTTLRAASLEERCPYV